ncbi:hypothetical protein IWX81_001886 [Salinibacterium sp. CAN_S4]
MARSITPAAGSQLLHGERSDPHIRMIPAPFAPGLADLQELWTRDDGAYFTEPAVSPLTMYFCR